MREQTPWKAAAAAMFVLILVSGLVVSAGQRRETSRRAAMRGIIQSSDCTYLQNPDEFRIKPVDRYAFRSATTARMAAYASPSAVDATTVDPNAIPRKNLIDNEIFGRMAAAGIPSAPLATDTEFLRRVTLDLTGRIPSPQDLANFLTDPNPSKRDALVDSLIGSPEFIDKWTMFFGDLLKNTARSNNVRRYEEGRDAFYLYIKDAVTRNKPYDVMARELITATGENFSVGEANWIVGGTIPMGPVQDTYDGQAAAYAATFLGINAADCLLCHDGAHHLDAVNLWGAKQTRINMWGLSAYFARTQLRRTAVTSANGTNEQLTTVNDLTTGEYRLNTTVGNRSARQPVNGVSTIAPKNPFMVSIGPMPPNGGVIGTESRRQALARQTIPNIQFSRAIVNDIWEKFMVEAFVTPTNAFDPSRLDPSSPPPAGWTLQPTDAELLNELAVWFRSNGYDVRALISLIAKSNAYALSSTYPGNWQADYVPYYARHYVRRLDAEEIFDAIQKATGINSNFTFTYLPAVQWAMQLPEPAAARGTISTFLSAFGFGDRDQNPRRSDGSLSETLSLMNSSIVMSRMHQNNAGSRVQSILAQTSDPATIIQLLYQNTLSRHPTSAEMNLFLQSFQGQTVRAATESLQWVLLNKLDFIFNY
jgi:hypothetical protein